MKFNLYLEDANAVLSRAPASNMFTLAPMIEGDRRDAEQMQLLSLHSYQDGPFREPGSRNPGIGCQKLR
jgi:hypothetical protein